MENSYLSTLGVCVPALGLCSAGIQLSTIRARFYYNVTSVATDKTQWPLRDVMRYIFWASNVCYWFVLLVHGFSSSNWAFWFSKNLRYLPPRRSWRWKSTPICTATSSRTLSPLPWLPLVWPHWYPILLRMQWRRLKCLLCRGFSTAWCSFASHINPSEQLYSCPSCCLSWSFSLKFGRIGDRCLLNCGGIISLVLPASVIA